MKRSSQKKKRVISERSKYLTACFIDSVLSKNNKDATKALQEMVNNRICAKIKKVAHSEDLI